MNISCKVVQDLLALYHDGVCSRESAQIVEKHLEECADCRKLLADMDTQITSEAIEEAKPLLSVRIDWNKAKRKAFLKGLAIAFVLCLLFAAGDYALTEWKCIPMDKDDLILMEVYQTDDGWIHFGYNDLYDLNYYSTSVTLGEDGYGYVECYRPIMAKREEEIPRHASAGLSFSVISCLDENGNKVEVDKLYLGVLNHPERSILMWEKGMEVRTATPQEQQEYELYRSLSE